MVEYVKVNRAGGSLVVTIPRTVVNALGLAQGDRLAIAVVDDQAVLTRIDPARDERRFLPRRVGK